MYLTMPLTGDAKLLARLRKASRIGAEMDRWANDSAEVIAQEARDLVNEGGIPSPNHVVSAPGNPPNSNTRNLVSHINAESLAEIGHAAAISDAKYARALEYGYAPNNLIERPYMRVAASNKRKAVLDAARKVVNKAVKG
jgi:hypothetical protein